MELMETVARRLQVQRAQVQAVMTLLEEGSTVPFIARYRKERTKGLDEEAIRQIQEMVHAQQKLEQRKADVLRLIDQQGKLDEEIKAAVEACEKLSQVEDLYRPYQQKRKTRAGRAYLVAWGCVRSDDAGSALCRGRGQRRAGGRARGAGHHRGNGQR